jgi:formamidopyrimidine-DNA glycosylase
MIAGRLHWKLPPLKLGSKTNLAALEFESGMLLLTEAASKKRASISVIEGVAGLKLLDPGGIDVLAASIQEFRAALRRENHSLKRALTDPRLFSGIGNAYSDEILHRARVSPLLLTKSLSDAQCDALCESTRAVMLEWIDRLRLQAGTGFPEKVTAFRPEMAVHGKFGQPCPVCAAPVQRIRYADNETNYCPRCQTDGKILADRSLSRLLKDDWPRHLDEL